MNSVNIEFYGIKELEAFLAALPGSVAKKFTDKVYRDTFNRRFIPRAKENARSFDGGSQRWGYSKKYASRIHPPGNLAESIGTITGRGKKYPSIYAGPKSRVAFGRGSKKWDGWYAHMIEFGHKLNNGKFQPPQPFMRPAWDETNGQMKDDLLKAYNAQLQKEMKKFKVRTK